MKDQDEVASLAVAALERSAQFRSVRLIGSVSTGTHDSRSDIDILLRDPTRPPWENVRLASECIGAALGVLLRDWAGSLVPEKYLLNHFLPGYPLFWWIDIGCEGDSAYRDLSRSEVEEERDVHLAKLLVMNAKHFLRRDQARLRIAGLHRKVFPAEDPPAAAAAMFDAIYAAIDWSNIPREFREKTVAVMDELARV